MILEVKTRNEKTGRFELVTSKTDVQILYHWSHQTLWCEQRVFVEWTVEEISVLSKIVSGQIELGLSGIESVKLDLASLGSDQDF